LMEVARRVPVRYETLLKKRKEPDFPPDHNLSGPERYDVIAIREYLRRKKSAHNAYPIDDYKAPPLNEREQAYADRAKVAADREKFKLAIEMSEYVPRISANRQIESANAVVRRELRKAMEFELPPRVEMMKAPEIRKIMVAKFRDIVAHLPSLITGTNGTNGQ
jgi:hypothetical protein